MSNHLKTFDKNLTNVALDEIHYFMIKIFKIKI